MVGCPPEPSQELPTWWMPRGSGSLASSFFSRSGRFVLQEEEGPRIGESCCCSGISIDGCGSANAGPDGLSSFPCTCIRAGIGRLGEPVSHEAVGMPGLFRQPGSKQLVSRPTASPPESRNARSLAGNRLMGWIGRSHKAAQASVTQAHHLKTACPCRCASFRGLATSDILVAAATSTTPTRTCPPRGRLDYSLFVFRAATRNHGGH